MKILILRFSSLGDIVLISPVIRALKTQLTDGQIHVATKLAYGEVVSENPYVDKVHLLDNDGLNTLIHKLRKEKFDLIIDLHNNLRTRWIKLRLGVKSKSFPKLNVEKWLLVNFKIDIMPPVHIVDRYMKTVEHLGVKTDNLGLDFFISEKNEVPIK